MRALLRLGHMEQHHITANIEDTPRLDTFEGRQHVVVPVIMARVGVEMNGGVIPNEEMMPESWNGVPVTVGHPRDASGYISANSPGTLETFAVGRIFNAHMNEGRLRAEAWIDTSRATDELISAIQSGAPMDVSTGYFSQTVNGEYRDIKPDHLALLPNEQGACSWQDGCGVRANQKRGFAMHIHEAMETIKGALGMNANCDQLEANRRGEDDDYRQMKADLISDDRTPFTAEDEGALEMMSYETMRTIRDQYMKDKDEEYNANASAGGETKKEANMADEESTPAVEPENHEAEVLTNEDRAALDHARKVYAEHRNSLVSKITANSNMTAEQCESMDVPTLETVANGLKPTPDYSGRAVPMANQSDDESKAIVEAMTPPTTADVIANRKVH